MLNTDRSILHRKKAVPTAIATSLDIGLSNLSLKTITLSFYSRCLLLIDIAILNTLFFPPLPLITAISNSNGILAMCKSSSLIFVLLFAFLFHLETFSLRLIGVIFLIFSGVLLMVATETHFVLSGLILVLSASALGGFRWSLTQLLLRNKEMGMDNPAATVFWLSPTMGLTLAIISAIVEDWAAVFGSVLFDGLSKTTETIFYLTIPGVMAFCMVLSEF